MSNFELLLFYALWNEIQKNLDVVFSLSIGDLSMAKKNLNLNDFGRQP